MVLSHQPLKVEFIIFNYSRFVGIVSCHDAAAFEVWPPHWLSIYLFVYNLALLVYLSRLSQLISYLVELISMLFGCLAIQALLRAHWTLSTIDFVVLRQAACSIVCYNFLFDLLSCEKTNFPIYGMLYVLQDS